MQEADNAQKEWTVLHKDIEKYERYSLVIKLFSVLITVLCIGLSISEWFAFICILILWLQNGIWNTFQSRLEARALFLERAMKHQNENKEDAFQLYTQWNENREGGSGLIKEYLRSSLRPTVAYPYIILCLVVLIFV